MPAEGSVSVLGTEKDAEGETFRVFFDCSGVESAVAEGEAKIRTSNNDL